jgi:dTDP-glucose 4,6-dehydratase
VDASKAKRELGWAPRRAFEEGIAETVRWYAEHGAWCAAVHANGDPRARLGLSGKKGAR